MTCYLLSQAQLSIGVAHFIHSLSLLLTLTVILLPPSFSPPLISTTPYICSHCTRTFSSLEAATAHERAHNHPQNTHSGDIAAGAAGQTMGVGSLNRSVEMVCGCLTSSMSNPVLT